MILQKLRSYLPWNWQKTIVGPVANYRPFSGGVNDAGVDVTPETAQTIATVSACIQVITDDLCGCPLKVIQEEKGNRIPIDDHYLHWVFAEPNPIHTTDDFLRIYVDQLLFRGTSFAYVKWEQGRVKQLWPVSISNVEPRSTVNGCFYKFRDSNQELMPWQMLHSTYKSLDGVWGLSPIQFAAQSMAIKLAADKFAAKFYSKGTHISGYLSHPGHLGDEGEEELKKAWQTNVAGIDNAHDITVLMDGVEWKPLGITPDEAQFLQSRQYQDVEICRLFRVHPSKVFDQTKQNYATLAAANQDHVKSCLRPWINRLEQELSRKLLSEEEKAKGYYIEFDTEGLLRGDVDSQDKSFATGVQFGWYSKNDVRRYKNLPPIEGGDEYLTPLNMAPAGEEPTQEELPAPTPTPEEQPEEEQNDKTPTPEQLNKEQALRDAGRLNPMFQDSIKRMLVKEVNAIKRAAPRSNDLIQWAEDWYAKHETLVANVMLNPLTAFDAVTAHERAADFATKHCEDSLQDLQDAITFDALPDLYERWLNHRAFTKKLEDYVR